MNGLPNNLAPDAERIPPKLASPAKNRFVMPALGALLVFAAGGMLYWFNPAQYRLYPFCFFHELTGLCCPGCGGTRALHQLLHGNMAVALHLNALLVISLPLLAWLGIRFVAGRFSSSPVARPVSPKWLWLFLALAVVFAVLRNLPAFAWLAP